MLGTLYPLVLDALGLGKISVGPPYFETVFVPLMAPALFLMGVGPIARWREASVPELAQRLKWALAVSVVAALIVPLVLGQWTAMKSFGLLLAFWIFASTIVGSAGKLRTLTRAQLGMIVAHLGIGVFVVGVAMVKGYEVDKDLKMEPTDTASVGGYTFRFDGVGETTGPNYVSSRGTVTVLRNGATVATLHPEKRFYQVQNTQMTEAAIDSGFTRDLYVALGEQVGARAWTVRIYHKPFVSWIWMGCVVMALGGLLAASDRRYRAATRRREAAQEIAGAAAPLGGRG